MTRVAYIDESQRGEFLALAAVAVPHAHVARVRKDLQALAPKGVARRHFVKESKSVRKQMLDVISSLPAAHFVCISTNCRRPIERRAELLDALVTELLATGLDRLWLDHVEATQQKRDRQVLARVLAGSGVEYSFFPPHATEPLLWAPDAVAWCSGADPEWTKRLNGWVTRITVP